MFIKKISSTVITDSVFFLLGLSTFFLSAMEPEQKKMVQKYNPSIEAPRGDVLVVPHSKHSLELGTIVPVDSVPGNYSHHHDHHTIAVLAKQLKGDHHIIKKYVKETVLYDIGLAKKAGRWLAWCINGLSYYAFDSIPFEFFKDNSAMERVFGRLEEGAAYIHNAKELFKEEKLGNTKKIDEGSLAEFLYRHAVDTIDVSGDTREILRKEPIKMDEYVRTGVVKKDDYMFLTLLNFVVRYYLEQELKSK